jgi:hypothetical protein
MEPEPDQSSPVKSMIAIARSAGVVIAIFTMLSGAFASGVFLTLLRADVSTNTKALLTFESTMQEMARTIKVFEPKITQNTTQSIRSAEAINAMHELLKTMEPENERYGRDEVTKQFMQSRDNFDKAPTSFWLAKP